MLLDLDRKCYGVRLFRVFSSTNAMYLPLLRTFTSIQRLQGKIALFFFENRCDQFQKGLAAFSKRQKPGSHHQQTHHEAYLTLNAASKDLIVLPRRLILACNHVHFSLHLRLLSRVPKVQTPKMCKNMYLQQKGPKKNVCSSRTSLPLLAQSRFNDSIPRAGPIQIDDRTSLAANN